MVKDINSIRTETAAKLKLNYKQTFLIGFGFFASSLLWALYNSFIPLLLRDFLSSTTLIGAVMTIDNIFGVVFQPLFGALSDRTDSRFGKRMPYIIIGAPICGILFAIIPYMRSLIPMMAVIILFNFLMSAWRSPMIALMPDLTPSPLRSQANGVINLMGGIAAIIAFLVGGRIADNYGNQYTFLMGAIVMIVGVMILFFGINENKIRSSVSFENPLNDTDSEDLTNNTADSSPADFKRNVLTALISFRELPKLQRRSLFFMLAAIFFWFCGYNSVETFYTSYAVTELHLSTGQATLLLAFLSVSFVCFAIPAGYLGEKFGRRLLITIGLIGVTTLFVAMFFTRNQILLKIGLALAGALWACVNINALPMVLEMAHSEEIGTFTGYYYFFSFSASIISPILFGLIRDYSQTYQSIFIYSPIAMLIAVICMSQVHHGDSVKR